MKSQSLPVLTLFLSIAMLVACGPVAPDEDLSLKGALSGKLYGPCTDVYMMCSLDLRSGALMHHPEIDMVNDSLPILGRDDGVSPDGTKVLTDTQIIDRASGHATKFNKRSILLAGVWSPDSRYVLGMTPDLTGNGKSYLLPIVIDATSGDNWSAFGLERFIANENLPGKSIRAYLWSPDSNYVAMIWQPPDAKFYLLFASRDGKHVSRYGDQAPFPTLRYWAP